MAKVKEIQPRKPSLNSSKLVPAGQNIITWQATTPHGVTREDILKPEFWAHVAIKVKPYSMIIATPEDGSFWAELLVLGVSRMAINVKELRHYDLSSTGEFAPDDYPDFQVKWSGPHTKYRVIRMADKQSIRDGFESNEEAHRWLDSHVKALSK